LKSINIGAIEKTGNMSQAEEYARKWESIQNDLGDDFDRFLGFIRTILLKEKARKSLLEEFEEKIYKTSKLRKGENTIEFIEEYYEIYSKIIDFSVNEKPLAQRTTEENNSYKNLIVVMRTALPLTDWIPPLLYFYNKFGDHKLLEFLKKLEFKFEKIYMEKDLRSIFY